MNRRTRWLNRALDLASAEPVLRTVHRLTGVSARVGAELRARAQATVEGTGVATRVDLAQIAAELAALTDAVGRLAQSVDRLAQQTAPAASDPVRKKANQTAT